MVASFSASQAQALSIFKQPARIINMKDRNLDMLKKDILLTSPFRLLEQDIDTKISEGGFGTVLSRAGVGKTAFLVQLALYNMLQGNNVLHISLSDSVGKVGLRYKELFQNLTKHYNVQQINELWETTLPHRFIMTFRVDSFNVPRIEERLTDITEQGIFHPRMTIIDGLHFDESVRQSLVDLKALAMKHSFHVWFSITTHRHEDRNPDDMPPSLSHVADLFDVALDLQPEGKEIHIRALKSVSETSEHPPLFLDPSTMLIQEKK
ncbi:MAG: cytoplasmic protein [Deltaproteobacteria bacterium]|nr:cytoplasmic protein [Deltaproteobacteria bacterium]